MIYIYMYVFNMTIVHSYVKLPEAIYMCITLYTYAHPDIHMYIHIYTHVYYISVGNIPLNWMRESSCVHRFFHRGSPKATEAGLFFFRLHRVSCMVIAIVIVWL